MTAALRPRRGFALLAALMLLATISLVALELATASRARRLAAANALDGEAASAAAQAGVEDAQASLVRLLWRAAETRQRNPASVLDPWAAADGMRVGPVALGPAGYEAALHDAGAALSLNAADGDALRRLLVALGVDAARADRVSQAVLDWRDADDLRHLLGAERADYLRAGLPVLPENAPFRTVATLRQVAGVDDELYGLVRPYLTAVGSGTVNLNGAPRPVLLALPGMTEESVRLVLRERARGRRLADVNALLAQLAPSARQRLVEALPAFVRSTGTETREVYVTSVGRDATGAERARVEALLVREGGVPRVTWRRVSP